MKIAVTQLDKKRDFLNVAILLLIALCIGIYLIATTAIIAKDGVTFIEFARQLETSPVKAMIAQDQHPGYPWLILISHKVMDSLHENTSILSWIYCAQSITLIFRLLAITVLYLIAQHLFGTRLSFWCVLILILLPKPAEYGSDALSDWPHLFFMVTGVLLLLKGATNERWWLFGFVGLAAGIGYLIRPECVQLVMVGGLWMGLQLLWPKHTIGKRKVLSGLAILFVGFLAIAGPYMNLKGALFPKKNVGFFTSSNNKQVENDPVILASLSANTVSPKIAKAFYKLTQNIGETLMWFFVPALLVGMYKWFKTHKWHDPEKFFVIAIIVLNMPVMIWLYCKHGYMSDRHTLPLLIIPILYVPVGLQELAIWFQRRFSGKAELAAMTNRNAQFWFLVLLVMGVCICTPKLFRPIRTKKQSYRAAAQWLKANTDSTAIIAVPDKRISFYAHRKGLIYRKGIIPPSAAYIVDLSQKDFEKSATTKMIHQHIDRKNGKNNFVVYRNLQPKI